MTEEEGAGGEEGRAGKDGMRSVGSVGRDGREGRVEEVTKGVGVDWGLSSMRIDSLICSGRAAINS